MKDGGQAFPSHRHEPARALGDGWTESAHDISQVGMTLRDYFAAHSLATQSVTVSGSDPYVAEEVGAALAQIAYAIADAMLAEREK